MPASRSGAVSLTASQPPAAPAVAQAAPLPAAGQPLQATVRASNSLVAAVPEPLPLPKNRNYLFLQVYPSQSTISNFLVVEYHIPMPFKITKNIFLKNLGLTITLIVTFRLSIVWSLVVIAYEIYVELLSIIDTPFV